MGLWGLIVSSPLHATAPGVVVASLTALTNPSTLIASVTESQTVCVVEAKQYHYQGEIEHENTGPQGIVLANEGNTM